MLAKHRWFSAAVIITLALGIGINSTVFTLVNAVLYKPLSFPGGERMVTVSSEKLTNPEDRSRISWPDFLELRTQNQSFESLEAVERGQGTISETDIPPERYNLGRVSAGLFEMLHTPPQMGRGFSPADGSAGAENVVLLSHGLWQQRYAGAADVLGRSIQVNGQPATVVGIMPDGFKFPNLEDLWMPLQPTANREDRTRHSLELFGLLNPGTTLTAAQSDLAVIAARLANEHPTTNEDRGLIVRTFHETYNGGPIKTIFLMMLGAVGFVLLIACANVANMMLGRAVSRGREIAVRAAVGASRPQLIRQLLVESVLLSGIGGLLGLAFSGFGLRAFDLATANVGRPYWITFEMDWRAALYFAAISISSGVVFGLVPALRASRVDLTTAIKEGTPGAGSSRSRLTGTLVVVQFALTVVLLAGAGAMIRSFFAVQELNAYTRPDTVFTARLQLPEAEGERYHEAETRQQFFAQLLPALRGLPGVTHAAAANSFPGLGGNRRGVEIEGLPHPDPENPPQVSMVVESLDYLQTVGVPLQQGRLFDANDGETGREAVIVSRAFAARHWPDATALGQRIRMVSDTDDEPWMTIIGICADMDLNPGEADSPPTIHLTYQQQSWGWMGLILRTNGDAATLATPVRQIVQRIDPTLPLFEANTLAAGLERQRWFLKVFGTVFSVFAFTGLLMAAVGIYGVIAHQTVRRTREIGIRMALGATARHIARLVLSRGLTQLGIGLLLGLAGAYGATSLLTSTGLLLGISAHDPLLFSSIIALLTTVGLSACWLPARRATKVTPTEALRVD